MSFQSKVVNWMGASCLAAYILHTNAPVMGWMIQSDEYLLNTNNVALYIGGAIGVCVGVFIITILLDMVRIMICKPLFDLMDKKIIKGDLKCKH